MRKTEGRYTVPADWYFIIFYRVEKKDLFGSGQIEIKSIVEPYKSTTDFDEFNNRFQPTGTYYESKEIKEEKKEKVEKKVQEIIEEKIEEERI